MLKLALYLSVPIYYLIVILSFLFVFVDIKYRMYECEVELTSLMGNLFFIILIAPFIVITPAYLKHRKTKNTTL